MSNFGIDIEKSLNRIGQDLQQFVERIVPLVDGGQDFTPSCDIIESDEEFKILVNLPGMKKEEITLTVKDHVLNVKGQRKTELKDDEQFVRRERKRGMFSRAFALPENVDQDKAKASFKNGVLEITINKLTTSEDSKSVPIQ